MPDTTPDDAIAAWLTTPEQAARTSPTPDLAELRRLAEAATPGPWSTAAFQLVIDVARRIDVGMCGHRNDAAFIAAANPATVLALLDAAAERDALAAQLRAFETDDQKLSIMNGWLVYEVGEHTCGGYGPESNYMHEPGCGYEPVLRLDKLQGWPAAELDALNGQLFDAGYRCGELLAENRALAAKVERVRAMPAKHPAGGWYMTSMRDVFAALDEEPQP